jgi:hypothetical protein
MAPGAAPDLIQPVVGFRQWRIKNGKLYALFWDVPWPNRLAQASCRAGGSATDANPHKAPYPDCSCGIYAYYRVGSHLLSTAGTSAPVTGIVTLWGRLEAHVDGMRAEHARIEALALREPTAWERRRIGGVARSLGIPAVPHQELESTALEFGTFMPPQLIPQPPPPGEEWRSLLGTRRPRANEGQTLEQAINAAVASVRAACDLEGLPIPSEKDVAAGLDGLPE